MQPGSGSSFQDTSAYAYRQTPLRPLADAATSWQPPVDSFDIATSQRPPPTSSQSVVPSHPTPPYPTTTIRPGQHPISPTPAALRTANTLRSDIRRNASGRIVCSVPENGLTCQDIFTRPYKLDRHRIAVHGMAVVHYHCVYPDCVYYSARRDKFKDHCTDKHPGHIVGDLRDSVTDAHLIRDGRCLYLGCTWYAKRVRWLQ